MAGAVGLGAFRRERPEARGLSVADVSSAAGIAPRLSDPLEPDRLAGLPAASRVVVGGAHGPLPRPNARLGAAARLTLPEGPEP